MIKEQITLYFRSGSSDKVYQVQLVQSEEKYSVNYSYGKRGLAQQAGTKTASAVDYARAKAIYDSVVQEKQAKGYTAGEDGVPYTSSAHADQNAGIRPQLLNPLAEGQVNKLINDPQWWMQEKHDGRRLLLKKQGGEITGINRRGLVTAISAALVEDAQGCGSDFLLDGEDLGDRYVVFDLLQIGGKDVRSQAYLERYLMLMHLLGSWVHPHLRLVETAATDEEKRNRFEQLEADGAEGVVFKDIRAPYTEGRPASGGPMLKCKFYETASFVVSRHNSQRSVNLALFIDGVARNAGSATIPPNHSVPAIGAVVEVRYLYAFAESGCIYQPVYLGVRADLTSDDCTVDQLKYKAGTDEVAA